MDAAPPLLHNHSRECACAKAGQMCPAAEASEGGASTMKHPVSPEFFTYWESKRGEARAPERSEVDPSVLREHLGDIFVLAYDDAATHRFRVAGTRVCALFGRDVKDQSFPALFARQHRRDISEIIAA